MPGTKGQDRLDRLEKLSEEMFAGIAQLRESQANYSQERREAQKKIDEEILALRESQAKTDEQLNRTDDQLSKTIKAGSYRPTAWGSWACTGGGGRGSVLQEPEERIPEDEAGTEEGEKEPQA